MSYKIGHRFSGLDPAFVTKLANSKLLLWLTIYPSYWINTLSNFRFYCWLNFWVNNSTMSENESKRRLSVPSPKFISGKIPASPSLGVFQLDLDKLWPKYEIQMIQKIQRDMVIRYCCSALHTGTVVIIGMKCFLNEFSFESTAKEWMHSFRLQSANEEVSP